MATQLGAFVVRPAATAMYIWVVGVLDRVVELTLIVSSEAEMATRGRGRDVGWQHRAVSGYHGMLGG